MSTVDNRYLLRVWRDDVDQQLRATLRNVSDGKVMSFRGLPELLEYLEAGLDETERADGQATAAQEERNEVDAQDLSR